MRVDQQMVALTVPGEMDLAHAIMRHGVEIDDGVEAMIAGADDVECFLRIGQWKQIVRAGRPDVIRRQFLVPDRYSTLLDFIFAACRPFSDAGLLTDQCEAVGDGGQLIATRNVAGGEAFLKQAADGGDQ